MLLNHKSKVGTLTWYFGGLLVLLGCCYMSSVIGVLRRSLGSMASSYVSGTHSMAFVTVPSMDVGKKLAHGIVQRRLAACVNIIPSVTSVYEWEGKVNEDSELILMIKTSSEKIPDLSKYVRENHPYDCAEVISAKIEDGNEPYLKWIGDTVNKPVV
ncbi:protein CutA homolog isoform X2 [Dreissena polymorpha]|uniref:protein CutA homolog isoform X1 n=1 Tax=Dreissena polymorpha TaxID=45954 RepID=UPI0022640A5E|nr:protein CutA homolog isoform X1 [Dreissena polymorpha]XP_052221742.1 protein CutA homolog isoform X2 [Dreissena polymorpha]XP_052221744.1 protein CutA homolog isoform X1 [Dreissena polymorpha]XP_052221745.1 protein CutA homolog isoform X2 [Dreissena polymorpha]